jgi:hypothetical protein
MLATHFPRKQARNSPRLKDSSRGDEGSHGVRWPGNIRELK